MNKEKNINKIPFLFIINNIFFERKFTSKICPIRKKASHFKNLYVRIGYIYLSVTESRQIWVLKETLTILEMQCR